MATRLLLPFTHGVNMFAIEQAILLAKSLEATLIPLSVIHVPEEGRSRGARLEHIQQSKDFLEAVKYKAARYSVPVERFEVFTADIVQSVNIVAKEQMCEGILLFLRGKKGVLLQAHEIKCLVETMVCKLYVLHMQSNGYRGSEPTFRERLSHWLPIRRRRQHQALLELQSYSEEMLMSPIEVTRPFPRRERAPRQHRRGGLFPGEPRLKRVVEPPTDLDNVGACLPDYSLTWQGQDGDT
jgi:hypothetical protein